MAAEIWKTINHFQNYQVSNFGNVRNSLTRKNISKWKTKNGYLQVSLYSKGTRKHKYVHRLVAFAFIPNPENLDDVNHIDEDKTNTFISNLEWISHLNNCNYGDRGKKISSRLSKQVIQLDLSGNEIRRYSSLISVEKYGFGFGNVANVCLGTKEKAYGYKWKYVRGEK